MLNLLAVQNPDQQAGMYEYALACKLFDSSVVCFADAGRKPAPGGSSIMLANPGEIIVKEIMGNPGVEKLSNSHNST